MAWTSWPTRSAADVIAVPCDVTSLDDCSLAVGRIVAEWGGVDVLINNAGITHISPFGATDIDVFRRVMDVNFFGALNMTSVALASLLERRGQIVVMSSVAGFAPLVLRTGYSASKHALHGCFDSLRAELRDSGVGVTLVCPSFVRTAIGDHALGAHGGAQTHTRTETGVPADPADLADAVFEATVRRRRLLLPSRTAKLSYVMTRVWPARYEQMMTRRIPL